MNLRPAPAFDSSTKTRQASFIASLMARTAEICEPMWKCTSSRQSSICVSRSLSTRFTISVAVSPNFERSPVDSIHLPAPLVVSLARTPMCGRMPSRRDTCSSRSSSR
jgi:hypothetical protein